eukprot:m.306686 g.306686  ORF g.306686 m.306686 type:complete len:61 (-) comp16352_c0_seq7:1203-1385(-)
MIRKLSGVMMLPEIQKPPSHIVRRCRTGVSRGESDRDIQLTPCSRLPGTVPSSAPAQTDP